jgi:glycosyltransferase involved in cell wall biosynthesis
MGYVKNSWLKRWLLAWEKKLYQKAKGIITLSPAIEKAIRAKGIRKNIATFTNLAHIAFFEAEKAGGKTSEPTGFDSKNPFVLLYAGALGHANGIDRILALASRVKHLPVRFQIMGEGPKKGALKQLAKKLALSNVEFLEHGNKEQTKLVLQNAHAVLVAYADFSLLSTGSPNKFFDGLAAGKPVLLTVEGWMMEKVQRHQCGYSFRPEDTQSFDRALSSYLKHPEAYQRACENASLLAKEYALEKVLQAQMAMIDSWMAK